MDRTDVFTLRALDSNYIYLIKCGQNRECIVIDPSETDPVVELLESNSWTVGLILNTHHHHDHVGGNAELAKRYNAPVFCSDVDLPRIPCATRGLRDGEEFVYPLTPREHSPETELKIKTLSIPGHTQGQIGYYIPSIQALFAGDTLFAMGCGRLFEGSAEQLWKSLNKILELPDDTRLYFGHEYTERNGTFAKIFEPENPWIEKRIVDCKNKIKEMGYCPPPTLGEEKKVNPFLRVREPALRRSLLRDSGMQKDGEVRDLDVFAEIRRRRDHF